jgi:hypothetical protein
MAGGVLYEQREMRRESFSLCSRGLFFENSETDCTRKLPFGLPSSYLSACVFFWAG